MYSCGYNFRLPWSWKKFLVFGQTLFSTLFLLVFYALISEVNNICRPRHSHYTIGWRPLYPEGLQINLASVRSGFKVQGSKFKVNRFAFFPLAIDSIGLMPREFNLWTVNLSTQLLDCGNRGSCPKYYTIIRYELRGLICIYCIYKLYRWKENVNQEN